MQSAFLNIETGPLMVHAETNNFQMKDVLDYEINKYFLNLKGAFFLAKSRQSLCVPFIFGSVESFCTNPERLFRTGLVGR